MFHKLRILKVYHLLCLTYVYKLETITSVEIMTAPPPTPQGVIAVYHPGIWNFI